jgi:hypothetical protein
MEGTAIATKVKVTGVREFNRACRDLGVSIEDMRSAFAAVAALGAASAASFAPKRTGTLASNIRGSQSASKAVVRSGGALVPYAGPINYSWPARNIAGAFFMQKADQVWQPYAMQRLKQELDKKIREEGLE